MCIALCIDTWFLQKPSQLTQLEPTWSDPPSPLPRRKRRAAREVPNHRLDKAQHIVIRTHARGRHAVGLPQRRGRENAEPQAVQHMYSPSASAFKYLTAPSRSKRGIYTHCMPTTRCSSLVTGSTWVLFGLHGICLRANSKSPARLVDLCLARLLHDELVKRHRVPIWEESADCRL